MSNDKKRKGKEDHNDDPIEESENSEQEEIVNVDFDFFSPKEVDFYAIKNLLLQLLGPDGQLFDVSSLANIIIEQGDLGSTVKTDGEESDPFALLSVINIQQHIKEASVKDLIEYFLKKTSAKLEFNRTLRQLLSPGSKASVGLIISERLINMPTEVMPPMYKMLHEEIGRAVDNELPFEFDYYLIISKAFTEEESSIEKEDKLPIKKRKRVPDSSDRKPIFYFHPEDEVFHGHALHRITYDYTAKNQDSDSRRTFQDYGIFPKGHLILVKCDQIPAIVEKMEQTFPPF